MYWRRAVSSSFDRSDSCAATDDDDDEEDEDEGKMVDLILSIVAVV